MRLVYRAAVFAFLVFLLYVGSGWAKEAVVDARAYMTLESTKMEMAAIKDRLNWSITYSSTDVRSYEAFLDKVYPADYEEMLCDNWGNEYCYHFSPNNSVYYLQSAGADGLLNTEDDLVVTNDEEY